MPATPKKPVTDTYHGVKVVDPYRWLENGDDPAVRKWDKEQNKYARAYRDKLPDLAALRKRLTELNSATSPDFLALTYRGGSGFSFADLCADFAGIAFARRLLDKPSRLADIEKHFHIDDYAIAPRGLPEGMTAADFAKKYGSLTDERYLHMQEDIRKRIDGLPGYRDPAEDKPDKPR